jgi:tetratricopeptide (TPR) repeat protein
VLNGIRDDAGVLDVKTQALDALLDTLVQEKSVQGSIDIAEQIIQLVSKDSGRRGVGAVKPITKLVDLLTSLGEFQRAREYQERLAGITRDLFGPQSVEAAKAREGLDGILRKLSEVGDNKAEINIAEQRVVEASSEAELNPADLSRQVNLVRSLVFLGDAKAQQDQYNEALNVYVEAFNAVKRLLDSQGEQASLTTLRAEIQERIQKTRLQTVAGGRA